MSKITNTQNFYFTTLTGEDVMIHCETYEHQTGWGHRATICYIGNNYLQFTKRQTYYNRTWECFTYETVIHKVLNAYFNSKTEKNELAFIMKQVDAIAQHEHEKAAAWCEAFTKKYNALSDETKDMLRKKDIMFNTTEQAETVINAALMLDALK